MESILGSDEDMPGISEAEILGDYWRNRSDDGPEEEEDLRVIIRSHHSGRPITSCPRSEFHGKRRRELQKLALEQEVENRCYGNDD